MDKNSDRIDISDRLADCLASLSFHSNEELDANRALARLRERDTKAKNRDRFLVWSVLPLVSVGLLVLALPSTRAIAQRFLQRFSATRFDVLPVGRGDLEKLPNSVRSVLVNPMPAETPVGDVAEAARQAGFVPRLPQSNGLGELLAAPKFSVIASISKESQIRVAELRTALGLAGANDVSVPEDWNGVVIGIQESAGIAADYGSMYLAQRLPLSLDAPPGFPVDWFLGCLFRIIGLSSIEAQNLLHQFAANPAEFLLIAPRYHDTRQLQLALGPAGFLQNNGKAHGAGVMLIWSTADRSYFLSGPLTESQAIAIANSIN
jgi:hypothetical protein